MQGILAQKSQNHALLSIGGPLMYKLSSENQLSFDSFNQPMGLTMNPENRWVIKSQTIPWSDLEVDYAKNFVSLRGNVAKPFRMALGALLIQSEFGFSDEELVLQIQENPYLQFFIGLSGYQEAKPFDASTLVYFRKRLAPNTLLEINEKIIAYNASLLEENLEKADEKQAPQDDDENSPPATNHGTLSLDATCAPQYIKYPTDIELLNTARLHAEKIIDTLCERLACTKPRTYRKNARKDYLNVVRRKRKKSNWLRKQIRKALSYVKRDIGYILDFISKGAWLTEQETLDFQILQKIFEQQLYMYRHKTHSVENRIVSFSQPWIRPIVRGKAKASVEFGAKLDLSVDQGIARLEKTSFEAYNESTVLVDAIRRYFDRHGYYPQRILVDKIYRNRENIKYCKDRGIRISGPSLGRPKKDALIDKQVAYQDNADRVEVERSFSLLKRKFSMESIRTKLPETTLSTLCISVIALNVSKFTALSLCFYFQTFQIYSWKRRNWRVIF